MRIGVAKLASKLLRTRLTKRLPAQLNCRGRANVDGHEGVGFTKTRTAHGLIENVFGHHFEADCERKQRAVSASRMIAHIRREHVPNVLWPSYEL